MQNEQYHRRRPRKKPRYDRLIGAGVGLVLVICALVFLVHTLLKKDTATPSKSATTSQSQKSAAKPKTSASEAEKDKNLPDSKVSDWDLVLVNRDHPKDEMSPDVIQIGNVWVDARIAEPTEKFLAAAQAINPAEHLISGYRSVDYQTTLYNQYVNQEMTADPSLDQEAAEKKVQTYSQPPTKSEHQTGLAIDLSDIDSLNESTTAEQVAAIAPEYGFVLRFPQGGLTSTGVDYEDWHFRYVGVANAKYMTEHHLTLEDYLKLLEKK